MRSIVVVAYNQQELTRDCLAAVARHTTDYEVVLVDNGSTPPIEGARIRNATNRGFGVAANQGVALAQGDPIILLNNDVIVTPGWAERLEAHLAQCAIVAPLANYSAAAQQVTLPAYYDEATLDAQALAWSAAHAGELQPARFVIGFVMVFRRALWAAFGPFDETFWPCSGEEVDFCLRAHAAGHRVGIARDVYVHHYGSRTFQAMEAAGEVDYQATCTRNDAHLAARWGADFWARQLEAA